MKKKLIIASCIILYVSLATAFIFSQELNSLFIRLTSRKALNPTSSNKTQPIKFEIPANGKEVFPKEELRGRQKVTLTGTIASTLSGAVKVDVWGNKEPRSMSVLTDPCYYTDGSGNFTREWGAVLIDGEPLDDAGTRVQEDRGGHTYSWIIELDNLHRPGFKFNCPDAGLNWTEFTGASDGSFVATIEPFTEPSMSVATKATIVAGVVGVPAIFIMVWLVCAFAIAKYLSWKFDGETHLLEPEYQENCARTHRDRILAKDKRCWKLQRLLLTRTELARAWLERREPHTLSCLEARMEIMRHAERMAVQPSEPKERKETPEEYRQRQLNRLKRDALDDKAALLAAAESEFSVLNALEAEENRVRQDEALAHEQKDARIKVLKSLAQQRLNQLHMEGRSHETQQSPDPFASSVLN